MFKILLVCLSLGLVCAVPARVVDHHQRGQHSEGLRKEHRFYNRGQPHVVLNHRNQQPHVVAVPVVHHQHVDSPIVHHQQGDSPVVHHQHVDSPIVHHQHVDSPVVHHQQGDSPLNQVHGQVQPASDHQFSHNGQGGEILGHQNHNFVVQQNHQPNHIGGQHHAKPYNNDGDYNNVVESNHHNHISNQPHHQSVTHDHNPNNHVDSNNYDTHHKQPQVKNHHGQKPQGGHHSKPTYGDNAESASYHGRYGGGPTNNKDYGRQGSYSEHNHVEEGPPMPYAFAYGVQDKKGAMFGQKEESDGNTVKGSYSVDLPDGRKQIVRYTADHLNGFQADVSYIGEAHYPEQPQNNHVQQQNHNQGGGYKASHSHQQDRGLYNAPPRDNHNNGRRNNYANIYGNHGRRVYYK